MLTHGFLAHTELAGLGLEEKAKAVWAGLSLTQQETTF